MNNIKSLEIDRKRIKVSRSQYVDGDIIVYGQDNTYPNDMDSLILQSQTAKACSQAYAKFLATGFVDENIGKTVVSYTTSGKKYTLKDLLKGIAISLSKFNGAYVLVNKNLAGEVVSAEVLDFQKVRFSSFDDTCRSNYAYVGDWAGEIENTKKSKKKKFLKYPLFNVNYDVFRKMGESTGTTASVYHIFVDNTYIYPSSPFEPVIYDMGTEAEIQLNRYEEITQGSPSKLIIRTDFAGTDVEQEEQLEEIQNFAGSKGNRVLVIKTQFDENGQPITNGYQLDTIEDTRDLSKFGEAEINCANNIRKVINIPQILIDFEGATGLQVSGEQQKSAVRYMDRLCVETRELISESLAEIFDKTSIKFPSKNFELSHMTIDE